MKPNIRLFYLFNLFTLNEKKLHTMTKKEHHTIQSDMLSETSLAASSSGLSMQGVMHELHAKYNALVATVHSFFKPVSEKLHASLSRLEYETTLQSAKEKLDTLRQPLQSAKVDVDRVPLTYPWNYLIIPVLLMVALTALDGFLNHEALELYLPDKRTAIMVTVVMVVGLALLAHILGSKLAEAKGRNTKTGWSVLIGVPVAGFFYLLSHIRTAYFQYEYHPLYWAGFSFALFLGAVFISRKWMPTKADWRNRKDFQSKYDVYTTLLKQQKSEEKRIAYARSIHAELLSRITREANAREQAVQHVERYRELCYHACVKEYVLKGGNGADVPTYPSIINS